MEAATFGLTVVNPYGVPVDVGISGPAVSVHDTIAAYSRMTYVVPVPEELLAPGDFESPSILSSITAGGGALRLTSSSPVALYQFNPQRLSADDVTTGLKGEVSLVLPVHRLSTTYTAVSQPAISILAADSEATIHPLQNSFMFRGFLTIVATEGKTHVTVAARAHLASGADVVPAITAGSEETYSLDQGDVLQLLIAKLINPMECDGTAVYLNEFYLCLGEREYDLSGTRITATRPVAVWSGHAGAVVSFPGPNSGRLEEMLHPQETWGRTFVVGLSPVLSSTYETPELIRIQAGSEEADLTFVPAVIDATTLPAGEFLDLLPPAEGHFTITSNTPIQVATIPLEAPSLTLLSPVEQFQSRVDFATSLTAEESIVMVVATMDAAERGVILLDGEVLGAERFEPVGDGGWGVATVSLATPEVPDKGLHRLWTTDPTARFGVQVFSREGAYASRYPAGTAARFLQIP